MKKMLSILLVVLMVSTIMPISVIADVSKDGPVCLYTETYSEDVSSAWEDEQFRHLAKASNVASHVTRSVTVTSSLSIKGGYQGNVNFILANSKVNFELSRTGTDSTTTTITWDIPGDNNSYYLVAGKMMQRVEGTKTTIYTDCSSSSQTTKLEGSTMTYHETIRQ